MVYDEGIHPRVATRQDCSTSGQALASAFLTKPCLGQARVVVFATPIAGLKFLGALPGYAGFSCFDY